MRIAATRAIGDGVRQWPEKDGFDVNRPELRAYLAQWEIKSRASAFDLPSFGA